MMVLAVDVVGHGAAQGHEPGPGHDRREPAVGHGDADQGVEGQAGIGPQNACGRIEGVDAIEPRHGDDAAIED